MTNRPHCQQPEACKAKSAGHCPACNCRIIAKQHFANPVFAAKHSARIKAMHKDPAYAAALKERGRERMKARHVAYLASLGLMESERVDYRTFRRARYTVKEAVAMVVANRRPGGEAHG